MHPSPIVETVSAARPVPRVRVPRSNGGCGVQVVACHVTSQQREVHPKSSGGRFGSVGRRLEPIDVDARCCRHSSSVHSSDGNDLDQVLYSGKVRRVACVEAGRMGVGRGSDEEIHHSSSRLPARGRDS